MRGWTPSGTKVLRLPNEHVEAPLVDEELALLVSLLDVGIVLGPYPTAFLMDRWGRRTLIIMAAPLALFGWILIYFASSVSQIIIARLIQGLCNGLLYLVVPVFACELAPAEARGLACTVTSGAHSAGIMFSFVVGNACSLRTLNLACTFAPILFLFVVLGLPETPYYYLMKGDETKARGTCARFDERFSEARFKHMASCVQVEMRRSVLRDVLVNPAHPFITVMVLGMAMRFAFFWNTPSHAAFIFRFGDANFSTGEYSAAMSLLFLLAVVCSGCVVREIGRRKTAIIAESATVILVFPAAFLFYRQDKEGLDNVGCGACILVLVSLHVFFANFGIAPMPIVQQVEFFPTNCRAIAGALLITVSFISGWIADLLFGTIVEYVGLYCNYIISGSVATFIFLVTWLIVPEVKGVSLHDIQLDVKFPSGDKQKMDVEFGPEKKFYSIDQNFRRRISSVALGGQKY
ncbi:facilitated trehalose transporter Tret1 [Bemisia tabaci]|uniref:facilitated trehalose transporter Tret1 n=1 Tax=Bemisia tabaci TaxID=7038 RepID=UPI003B28CB3E